MQFGFTPEQEEFRKRIKLMIARTIFGREFEPR